MKHKAPKPIEGQRSLLADVPPVRHCRRCGLLLRKPSSIDRRLGPKCAKAEALETQRSDP